MSGCSKSEEIASKNKKMNPSVALIFRGREGKQQLTTDMPDWHPPNFRFFHFFFALKFTLVGATRKGLS